MEAGSESSRQGQAGSKQALACPCPPRAIGASARSCLLEQLGHAQAALAVQVLHDLVQDYQVAALRDR
jgi:hypothetical protein